jgi:conjugative transposon TraM protein
MKQVVGMPLEKKRRELKVRLLAPLLVAPMLCLVFYGLGGGRGAKVGRSGQLGKGLNMSLPDARFDPKRKTLNKLGAYDKAHTDSLKLSEIRKRDPNYLHGAGRFPSDTDTRRVGIPGLNPGLGARSEGMNAQADELLGKLNALKSVLSKQASGQGLPGMSSERPGRMDHGADGDRWPVGTPEGQMLPPRVGDPDLDKLGGMLDKILRIQHPEENKLPDSVRPGAAQAVTVQVTPLKRDDGVSQDMPGPASGTDSMVVMPGSGFYDLDEEVGVDSLSDNLLEAAVVNAQTLVSGESVQLRLLVAGLAGGVRIPAGALMTGKASLSGERLQVQVNSIRLGGRSVAVGLEVVDEDGVPGIREPGSMNRDVAKESLDQGIGDLGLTSVDQSVGAQAAAAGIQAMKTLVSRKVRLVRVSIPAGYRVWLRNVKANR